MHRSTTTTTTSAVAVSAVTAALAAVAALAVAAPALAGGGGSVRSTGDLVRYSPDRGLLPAGAAARVHYVGTGDGRTRVRLHVTGLAPGHTYGAHAHVLPCGEAQGGGHYRHDGNGIDPANEIWLDVSTNADGNGHTTAEQNWPIARGHGPKSVIIHAAATDPQTGLAGAKLACVDVAV